VIFAQLISYMDILLIVIIIALLVCLIGVGRKTQKNISELRNEGLSLANYQKSRINRLDGEYALLKEVLLDKEIGLKQEISELSKKNSLRFEEMEGIILKVEKKMDSIRASVDDSVEKINRFQDSFLNVVRESEKEVKRLEKEIKDVSEEITNLKDLIQGRIIDVEL
jgi:peptidoglycan hydrolase CwlO-like protein